MPRVDLAAAEALYTLGFSAEYVLLNFWRRLRDLGAFTGQLLALMCSSLGGMLLNLLRGIAADISRPFRELARRRRLLRQVRLRALRRQGPAAGAGRAAVGFRLHTFFQFVAQLGAGLLPVGAAAVLVFIVCRVIGMEYALEVRVNGEFLGYVADQGVVENAKGVLRDRIRLAPTQKLTDWQFNPSYTIRGAGEFTTTQQLVNNILLASTEDAGDLTVAVGLEIDGRLYAVTDEADKLRAYLDGLIGQYAAMAEPGSNVEFVRTVELDDPKEEPVYFTSSVEPAEAVIERLNAVVAEERRYTADGRRTLTDIARSHGVTYDTLLARNPGLRAPPADGEAEIPPADYVPPAGTELLIQYAQPFLQVQTSVRVRSLEVSP
jgi:hypothetical protein